MGSDMDQPTRMAKGALRGVAEFLWPQRSLVSGQRGVGKGPLTASEFAAIGFLSDPVCNTCGRPMELDLGPEAQCAACIARPPRSTTSARAFQHPGGVARDNHSLSIR